MHTSFVPAIRKKARKITETDRKEARNEGSKGEAIPLYVWTGP
jgi:hypothetical protein